MTICPSKRIFTNEFQSWFLYIHKQEGNWEVLYMIKIYCIISQKDAIFVKKRDGEDGSKY